MEGDRPYRFMSFNIPNLHLVEDNFSFENPNPWRWPDEFEIRDSLESIRQMGGNATRIYVLSVKREGSDMGDHVFVRGPGDFNEEAFRVLDKVLQVANETGVRVLIPLVDEWKWWGGRAEYAKFRGKSADEFWTNPQVIADFKQTIRFTLNRVNTLTGVAYKDDPAIFGWETGNEIDSTPAWTREISAYIKSIDSNHLVVDGYSLHGVRESSLDDPNIDVITTHHYPNTDTNYVEAITAAHTKIAGRKPYFVGEFGFAPLEDLGQTMDLIIDKRISGGMLWSLRVHNRDGGFYWHSEPAGGNHYKAYHWPGFHSGDAYDEAALLRLVREKAYQIRSMKVPPVPIPKQPKLLPIPDVSRISWQGSTGANSYDVERGSTASGPWTTVGENLSDAAVQYRPLFSDETAEIGNEYFYRVRATNASGTSPPSNIVGPVRVAQRTIVDECRDFTRLHDHSSDLKVLSLQARKTQEDIHRFELSGQGYVVYETSGPIETFQILLFNENGTSKPRVACSTDGKEFHPCELTVTSVSTSAGDYGYLNPMKVVGNASLHNARYLRIEAASDARLELSRVEIGTGKAQSSRKDEPKGQQGAQLNPSILMFHKPWHVHGVKYVQRAASLGCKKVNVVLSLSCQINRQNEVINYGIRSRRGYMPLTKQRLAQFKAEVKKVLAAVAAKDMQLSVLLHLNAAGPRYEWRNLFFFDPLTNYRGFNYQDTLVSAVTEALAATPQLKQPVDIALAGEMGRSVFSFPGSYLRIVEQLKSDPSLPELRLGISLNFADVADQVEQSDRQRYQLQQLIDVCDFLGLSNYSPFELPIEPNDFATAKQNFLSELADKGIRVPEAMPLHFSEVSIGGGTEQGLAKSPAEAAHTPWEGSDNPRKNPWASQRMRQFRLDYFAALLDYLANPPETNPITDAYLWSEGSWDPLDTTSQGFADPEIIRMIQQHNRAVAEGK